MVDSISIAKEALGFGFVPIPICDAGGKSPGFSGWPDVTRERALALVAAHAGCNIGILTGAPSGVFVIDVDTKDGGMENWAGLVDAHGLPETPVVITGSGGLHIYLRYSEELADIAGKAGALPGYLGIDTRTNRNQVVYPGSLHRVANAHYRWQTSPAEVAPATAPDWLLQLLRNPPRPTSSPEGELPVKTDESGELYRAMKDILWRLSDQRVDGYDEWCAVIFGLHNISGGDEQLLKLAHEWSARSPKYLANPAAVDAKWKDPSPNKTIGMGSFKHWLRQDTSDEEADTVWAKHFRRPSSPQQQAAAFLGDERAQGWLLFCEKGSTLVLIDDSPLAYIWDFSTYLWKPARLRSIVSEVQDYVSNKRRRIAKELENSEDEDDRALAKRLSALKPLTNQRAEAIVRAAWKWLLRPEFGDTLNSSPHELPIRGRQVVDLRTGQSRIRTPDDRFTFECPVGVRRGEHPNVLQFFRAICRRDEEQVYFMQKMLGYFLTGDISARKIFVWWGEGANGKSSLLQIMGRILGPFCAVVRPQVFVEAPAMAANAHTAHIVPLIGARMACTTETKMGAHLDESFLKQLTGADNIAVREMHRREISFRPQCKPVLQTNNKPVFNFTDQAMQDRMCFVPFLARFTTDPKGDEERADPDFIGKLQREHLDEVFTWILEGAAAYYAEPRIETPAGMRGAYDEYIAEIDSVQAFVEERCALGSDFVAKGGRLYDEYRSFCSGRSELKKLTTNEFFERLVSRYSGSITRQIRHNARFFVGVTICSDN